MMSVTATQIFDFAELHEDLLVERHEIASASFGVLRRALRKIVIRLRDADDQTALDLSDRLRALLSGWLTVPIFFDSSILEAVAELLGESDAVQSRWGVDIRALYEKALRAAADLSATENPVREKLRMVIRDLRSQGQTFKVYCHRRARPHFESLLILHEDLSPPNNMFLHSVRDYRDAEPFDVLIKVGPLRTGGWGSAPDAILTAPRYGALVQIVWSGCNDEPGFGYDPSSQSVDATDSDRTTPSEVTSIGYGSMMWTRRVIRTGEDPGDVVGDSSEDELRVFRAMDTSRAKRSATLIQIDEDFGIMYPPHAQILSIDPAPAAIEPIRRRILGETLLEGMFIIRPAIDDVDLGGTRAEHGQYSRIWKAHLSQELRNNTLGLIHRLRQAGLNLLHLRSALGHWCESPTTVIHAPQKMNHFEILIQVLGLNSENGELRGKGGRPGWRLAWAEICRTRGEAIQAGFQGHEIVEEELVGILQEMLPQIRENASSNRGFQLAIPDRTDVNGAFLFFNVVAIEPGFHIPEPELKSVLELDTIDQWRD